MPQVLFHCVHELLVVGVLEARYIFRAKHFFVILQFLLLFDLNLTLRDIFLISADRVVIEAALTRHTPILSLLSASVADHR